MKHQTNISELKRTFLETSTDTAIMNEWEKRLSTSPVRLAARQEDAPMIEPLVPEEVGIQAVGCNCLLFTRLASPQGLHLEKGFGKLLSIKSHHLSVCNLSCHIQYSKEKLKNKMLRWLRSKLVTSDGA